MSEPLSKLGVLVNKKKQFLNYSYIFFHKTGFSKTTKPIFCTLFCIIFFSYNTHLLNPCHIRYNWVTECTAYMFFSFLFLLVCIFQKRDDFSNRNDLEFYHKTIFFVRVYYPFYHKYMKKNYSGNCKYSHEIGILGSQTLADLRDKILCNTDIGICREVEVPTPNLEIDSVKAKVSLLIGQVVVGIITKCSYNIFFYLT